MASNTEMNSSEGALSGTGPQETSRRIISPSREEFASLRQPLTPGERRVFEVFDAELDPAWEIYIQPHLNGLRPDYVLLNPGVGVAVFEVKDWDLDAMHYFVKVNRLPELRGRKDGKSFSLQAQNPITKVNYYREAIYKLYCPRLEQNAGFAAITAGVIFPFADSRRVRELFSAFTRDEAILTLATSRSSALPNLRQAKLAKFFQNRPADPRR